VASVGPTREPTTFFGVLGPLLVTVHGQPVRPPTEVPRAVLGALLTAFGPVSVPRLAALLGEPDRPARRSTVQVAVSRLRTWLRVATGDRLLVELGGVGYRLIGPDAESDVDRFRSLMAGVGEADLPEQLHRLQAALRLWRGEGLDDLPAERRDEGALDRLRRERTTAGLRLAAAALKLGQPGRALPQVEPLADLAPTEEELHASLLRLLAAAGRRADALRRYEAFRSRLREELGVDPGPELRRTHAELLRAEGTRPGQPPRRSERKGRPVPRSLPAAIGDFVGRQQELAELTGRLSPLRPGAPSGPVVAVGGGPGVGKTALAVRAAHRVRTLYPDGQLYLNLRRPDGSPLTQGAGLARLLHGLGVTARRTPKGTAARADLFRSLVAESRLLIVLDNALSEGQVRLLLPGGPRTAALVTSRRMLTALEGAHRLDLGPLSEPDSLRLLASIAGTGRVYAEPHAAATVAAFCGRLPLTLRIAGARLASRPHWSVRHLADRLADEERRLDELTAADLNLRVSLSLSYRSLPADRRHALRLLGLVALPEVTGRLAAALLDADERDALSMVDDLVDARLVEARFQALDQFGYRLPDLVRLYAAERAGLEEPRAVRRAAIARISAALAG
jgi:DNA-binding SARP family transcriptional activator